MDKIARYTFKFVGLIDSSQDNVELKTPEQLKGVKVTSIGDYDNCEQYTMSKIHEMITYFDDTFKMDGTKEIRVKLVHVDFAAALEHPEIYDK
jgi:hypothetical protein